MEQVCGERDGVGGVGRGIGFDIAMPSLLSPWSLDTHSSLRPLAFLSHL